MIIVRLKKISYKVILYENRQQQSFKAYLSVQKWLVVDVPLNVNFALSEPSLRADDNDDIQITFLHHRVHELRSSKYCPFFLWPTWYI